LSFPVTEGSSTLNRDTLFALELHRVHLGTNGVSASNLVDILDTASVE
jgi:hypothetical protein